MIVHCSAVLKLMYIPNLRHLARVCCICSLPSVVVRVLEDCSNTIFPYNFERAHLIITSPICQEPVIEIVVRMCPAVVVAMDCLLAHIC